MKISTYHNDDSRPTLTIDSFESRTYRLDSATSVSTIRYKAFTGRILETIICPEKIDEDEASRIIYDLISRYSNPDVTVLVAGDSRDNGCANLEEISVIRVINYIDANNERVPVRDNVVAIYKKHTRDIYISAVAKLAYEIQFGEGSYE